MGTESSDNRSRRSNDDRREAEPDAIVQKSHEITSTIKQATLDRVDGARADAHALRENTSQRVRKLGAAVHKVGEHFRIEDQQYISEQMIGAGKHIGKLADYVESAQIGTLIHDARQLARRNTTVFWGSAFLLGLGTARFFKGTSLMAGSDSSLSKHPSVGQRKDVDEVVATNGGEKRRPRETQSESKRERSRMNRDY